jgi:succinate dehydrogenase hydrophobic anchor subunit
MGLTIASNIARTFLDCTEKYLFEFNEINMFLVIMVEGIINVISFIIYFLAEGSPTQFEDSKYNKPFESKESLNFFILILLLVLYFLFCGLRNIYRVTTIKIYSPVVRALTEAIFDPFLIGSSLFEYKNTSFYWINMVCLVIMVFASLVFTEFIVLYCCGLEYYTHIEITRRAAENTFDDSQSASDIDENDRLSWISKMKLEERGSEMAIRKTSN